MSNQPNKLGGLQRLEGIETSLKLLDEQFAHLEDSTKRVMSTTLESIEGVVLLLQELHPEKNINELIIKQLNAKDDRRALEKEQREDSNVARMLEAGAIKKVDVVTEKSILHVTIEGSAASGAARKHYIPYQNLTQKDGVLGSSVGFKTTLDDQSLTILEIYEPVETQEATKEA